VVEIPVPPIHMNDLKSGAMIYLNKYLFTYVPELEGVVLAYRRLKSLSSTGRLLERQPHIMVSVSVHFLVFAPKVGSTLTGMVTRVGFDHIGLTVHGVFNASIPSDRLPPEYSRDTENDRFYVEDVNVADDAEAAAASAATGISVGDELEFVVTGLTAMNQMMSIEGSLPQGKSPAMGSKRK